MVKPGWKSTEFWGKVVLQVGALVFLTTGREWANPEITEPVIIAVIGALEAYYANSRGKAKSAANQKTEMGQPDTKTKSSTGKRVWGKGGDSKTTSVVISGVMQSS